MQRGQTLQLSLRRGLGRGQWVSDNSLRSRERRSNSAVLVSSLRLSSALLAAENRLEEFDVAIEVVVNFRRGKCRSDTLQQSRRVGWNVAAVGNTPERARHLL